PGVPSGCRFLGWHAGACPTRSTTRSWASACLAKEPRRIAVQSRSAGALEGRALGPEPQDRVRVSIRSSYGFGVAGAGISAGSPTGGGGGVVAGGSAAGTGGVVGAGAGVTGAVGAGVSRGTASAGAVIIGPGGSEPGARTVPPGPTGGVT